MKRCKQKKDVDPERFELSASRMRNGRSSTELRALPFSPIILCASVPLPFAVTPAKKMTRVRFELTPPKRLRPERSALDHSATLPYILYWFFVLILFAMMLLLSGQKTKVLNFIDSVLKQKTFRLGLFLSSWEPTCISTEAGVCQLHPVTPSLGGQAYLELGILEVGFSFYFFLCWYCYPC